MTFWILEKSGMPARPRNVEADGEILEGDGAKLRPWPPWLNVTTG